MNFAIHWFQGGLLSSRRYPSLDGGSIFSACPHRRGGGQRSSGHPPPQAGAISCKPPYRGGLFRGQCVPLQFWIRPWSHGSGGRGAGGGSRPPDPPTGFSGNQKKGSRRKGGGSYLDYHSLPLEPLLKPRISPPLMKGLASPEAPVPHVVGPEMKGGSASRDWSHFETLKAISGEQAELVVPPTRTSLAKSMARSFFLR